MSRRPARCTEAGIPTLPAGHVYFIVAHKAEAIKIGYSRNPITRFSNLNTGAPEELSFYGSVPADRALEAELHRRFAHLRINGEWFKECGEIYNHIEDLAEAREELQAVYEHREELGLG